MNVQRIEQRSMDPKGSAKSGAEFRPELLDLRFRSLLSRPDWEALPKRVRRRFSKRLAANRIALYAGEITEARFSRLGWLLAQVLSVIGGPLPRRRDINVPAAVCVAEDRQGGGQIWTRIYHHTDGFPQMINSAKRFAGPTGLEEHIGLGIGMALGVEPIEKGIAFVSDHYFWQIGKLRLKLPRWIVPGRTEVSHIDRGDGSFDFTLQLVHPLFGELLWQRAIFRDQ